MRHHWKAFFARHEPHCGSVQVGLKSGAGGMLGMGLVGGAAAFTSLPLLIAPFGASAVLKMIERWPILVWAGAGLLGWVAGEMIASDPTIAAWLDRHGDPPDILAAILGAAVVIAIAGLLTLRKKRKAA